MLLLTPLLLQLGNAVSQQATTGAGGNAIGNGGSASYSIGQVGYTTMNGTSLSVTAGVQQPYIIQTVGFTEGPLPVRLEVYPNPTSSDLSIILKEDLKGPLHCRIIDALGNVVVETLLEGYHSRLATGHLPASIYFLQVADENHVLQSFRIVKN
ncbi:MAG: hypothetical protein RL021_1784 [Bacteroidota bacterium]